jgi:hypothetical protein
MLAYKIRDLLSQVIADFKRTGVNTMQPTTSEASRAVLRNKIKVPRIRNGTYRVVPIDMSRSLKQATADENGHDIFATYLKTGTVMLFTQFILRNINSNSRIVFDKQTKIDTVLEGIRNGSCGVISTEPGQLGTGLPYENIISYQDFVVAAKRGDLFKRLGYCFTDTAHSPQTPNYGLFSNKNPQLAFFDNTSGDFFEACLFGSHHDNHPQHQYRISSQFLRSACDFVEQGVFISIGAIGSSSSEPHGQAIVSSPKYRNMFATVDFTDAQQFSIVDAVKIQAQLVYNNLWYTMIPLVGCKIGFIVHNPTHQNTFTEIVDYQKSHSVNGNSDYLRQVQMSKLSNREKLDMVMHSLFSVGAIEVGTKSVSMVRNHIFPGLVSELISIFGAENLSEAMIGVLENFSIPRYKIVTLLKQHGNDEFKWLGFFENGGVNAFFYKRYYQKLSHKLTQTDVKSLD